MKRIDVIGFGPGNYDYMTIEAVQALKEADVIVGYSTYVELLKRFYRKEIFEYTDDAGSGAVPYGAGRGRERTAGCPCEQRRQRYLQDGRNYASGCSGGGSRG